MPCVKRGAWGHWFCDKLFRACTTLFEIVFGWENFPTCREAPMPGRTLCYDVRGWWRKGEADAFHCFAFLLAFYYLVCILSRSNTTNLFNKCSFHNPINWFRFSCCRSMQIGVVLHHS
jgi:hypothetical protein